MSISFDRVASIYDETRRLPPAILQRVADAIIDLTGMVPTTDWTPTYLELGVGTGRIALPLIERGVHFTGVDISEEMLQRLREKLAAHSLKADILRADITQLPFPSASFDVVIAVHVLHLVPEWHKALYEAQRVLRRDGYIVVGSDQSAPSSPKAHMNALWRDIVHTLGESTERPGAEHFHDIVAALQEMGGQGQECVAARWVDTVTPRQVITRIRDRIHSATWLVSDEGLRESLIGLEAELRAEYGDLDRPLENENQFLLYMCQLSRHAKC
jgi:ubiquinone/menaquinone biosynthesis C-methylase UbiE